MAVAIHEAAVAFYHQQLTHTQTGARARAELTRRGLPPQVTRAGVGYAPPGWSSLVEHLLATGWSGEDLLLAGVATRSKRGTLIDRFRDRITFAIHDEHGRPVGFTARAFDAELATAQQQGKDLPKYLNTCETPTFAKARLLYGLGHPGIREALAAGAVPVLVEGPVDALAIQLASAARPRPATNGTPRGGYAPGWVGLALCGTALTLEHLTVLDALIREVSPGESLASRGLILAVDPDAAGRAAAARAWPMLRARDIWPSHLNLPAGADPADVLRHHGAQHLAQQLQRGEATPLLHALLDDATAPFLDRIAEVPSQVAAVRAAVALLADTPLITSLQVPPASPQPPASTSASSPTNSSPPTPDCPSTDPVLRGFNRAHHMLRLCPAGGSPPGHGVAPVTCQRGAAGPLGPVVPMWASRALPFARVVHMGTRGTLATQGWLAAAATGRLSACAGACAPGPAPAAPHRRGR
ncbi:Toprim domain-containing protein [Kineococcus xinjiangensis]|uniref:Toprim domain-containing protein n=1 Tax=Kineococcus xinjiangensis TaxID=512762 RepID=A0A2S6IC15_9ACTN|nr:toprim domain-containing protein [Kineococcus xinjiangensis]PPK90211.1 Toprim domain-containing protein [Kineococcus xinjiangensis]